MILELELARALARGGRHLGPTLGPLGLRGPASDDDPISVSKVPKSLTTIGYYESNSGTHCTDHATELLKHSTQ